MATSMPAASSGTTAERGMQIECACALAFLMVSTPTLLDEGHDVSSFDCGHDVLNDWLRKRARANQVSGASRTFVISDASRVTGYYCLASGAMALEDAAGFIRRNMPDPMPMAILGRLAIDHCVQGPGLGVALLQDAALRTAQAAHIAGIRVLLVHAISDDARSFYGHYGFTAAPRHPMTLVLSLKGLGQDASRHKALVICVDELAFIGMRLVLSLVTILLFNARAS